MSKKSNRYLLSSAAFRWCASTLVGTVVACGRTTAAPLDAGNNFASAFKQVACARPSDVGGLDDALDLARRTTGANAELIRLVRHAGSDWSPSPCSAIVVANKALSALAEIDAPSAIEESERLLNSENGMPLLQWTSTSVLVSHAPDRGRKVLLDVFRRKPPYWVSVLDYAQAAFRREDVETVELLRILRSSTASESATHKQTIADHVQYYSRLLGEPVSDGGVK
jgi:hypothetical protein